MFRQKKGGAAGAVLPKGDALLGAIGTAHNGRKTGATPARVLVVFMGGAGLANSTEMGSVPAGGRIVR